MKRICVPRRGLTGSELLGDVPASLRGDEAVLQPFDYSKYAIFLYRNASACRTKLDCADQIRNCAPEAIHKSV
jgi:hypothetical protein